MPDRENKPTKKRKPGEGGPSMRPGKMLLMWFAAFACILGMVHLLSPNGLTSGHKKRTLQLNEFWALMNQKSIQSLTVRGTEGEASVIYYNLSLADGKKAEGLILGEEKGELAFQPFSGDPLKIQTVDIIRRETNSEPAILSIQFPQDYLDSSIIEKIRGMLPLDGFNYYKPPFFKQLLLGMIPWLLLVLLFWFIVLRQMRGPGGGSVLSFGKSRARLATKVNNRVTFDDVAGIEEAKSEVHEIIEFLKNPDKFQRLGGRIPRGILLVGSPGTGKTLLAKAIAGEADVPFFSISGSDFVEMFVGIGASRVRDLFRQARENSPCIIFLDEIDAVGRRRGAGLGGGHDEREQTLNAILVEMDGFDTDSGIILIAATNRPDVLDPALLRPGRFDRQVVVDAPDMVGREAILKVHSRDKKLAPDVDLKKLAKSTPFFSGADLENLMNEAALTAALNGKSAIDHSDLEEARDKVQFGREKRSRMLHEEETRVSAYHETGHAVVSKLVPNSAPLHKVTIIPRGRALGATHFIPEHDPHLMSRKKILGDIQVLLAGRAAEELFLDDITSGAQNDFERATELARMMVCKWGMSESLGPISYTENEENVFLGRDITRVKTISETTAVAIDGAIKEIIENSHSKALQLLSDRRPEVEAITKALLRKETLDAEEVDALMNGKEISFKDVEDTDDANGTSSGGGEAERTARGGESESNASTAEDSGIRPGPSPEEPLDDAPGSSENPAPRP